MTHLIKMFVYTVAASIALCIASAYVFYFVGMAVSLAAGGILFVPPQVIASIFAWLGIVFTAYACIMFFEYTLKRAVKELDEEDGKQWRK